MGKQSKSTLKALKNTKGKAFSIPSNFFTRNKGVQFRTFEEYSNIQSERANILKKKKVMTTSWSDKDFEES